MWFRAQSRKTPMDNPKLVSFIDRIWDRDVIPALVNYIGIPNKSPMFDPEWVEHGHMDKAVALFEAWGKGKIAKLPGATLEVVRLPGRTPLISDRDPGKGARHGAALWPSRQAAGNEGLGRRLGAVDAGAEGQQIVWPRRGRRRLRHVRFHHGDSWRSPNKMWITRAASSPSKRAKNRDRPIFLPISNIWQRASACPISSSAWIRVAAITISYG